MNQKLKNWGNLGDRLFGQLAAEKKKTVMAVCLITVMVFMWVRVFSKKGPQSAQAARSMRVASDTSGSEPELKISYTELPEISGRNDVLTRDFFASNGWQWFDRSAEGIRRSGIEEVTVLSKDGSEETANRIAQELNLEAISAGGNPQAFINDKLLNVGDKLSVSDGTNMYECEVIGIRETEVLLRCGEAKIRLKLTQTIENGEY